MVNKTQNEEERLDAHLNFVSTQAVKDRVLKIAKARGVSYAVALRWAVDFWLSAGAPTPNPENEETAS